MRLLWPSRGCVVSSTRLHAVLQWTWGLFWRETLCCWCRAAMPHAASVRSSSACVCSDCRQGLGTADAHRLQQLHCQGPLFCAHCDLGLMLCCAVQGSMSALPVTLISRSADGSRHFITPPPAHILPQASIEAAQVRWGGVCGFGGIKNMCPRASCELLLARVPHGTCCCNLGLTDG